jgi:hypothetical protein
MPVVRFQRLIFSVFENLGLPYGFQVRICWNKTDGNPLVKDLLPSKRTQRATFRATMPLLSYLLPSGRTKRATFEAIFLSGGNRHKVSKNFTPQCKQGLPH